MKKFTWILALAATSVAAHVPASAGGVPEPVTSVALAKTWDAAVEEAKALNVPIVVHSHGMFCGPCWSMHTSVMCNKKYIEFANDNTVEVISLGSLQEGIDKKDRKTELYKSKDKDKDGKPIEYMVEFPGLTVADMLSLASSKAASYNNTGGIPYTCLVDPYTLAEIAHWKGGQGASTIIDAVTEAKKALQKEHGKGITRKDLKVVTLAANDATEKTEKGDYAAAIEALAKVGAKAKEGTPLAEKVKAAKDRIIEAATAALVKIEEAKDADPVAAKRDLIILSNRLKGTGLENRAKDLLATL